jgi:hypothetical protein
VGTGWLYRKRKTDINKNKRFDNLKKFIGGNIMKTIGLIVKKTGGKIQM